MANNFSFDPSNPIFKGLNSKQLEILSSFSREVRLNAGESLMNEGDIASEMYFIIEGTLEVVKHDAVSKQKYVISSLHAGDTVGEIALIDRGRRSANVRATTPVILRSLAFNDLDRLFEQDPDFKSIYFHLSHNMISKLRKTTDIAAEVLKQIEDEHQTRVYMGQFLVYIIVVLALIIYSLKPLNYLLNHAANSTNVTIPVIVCLTVFVFLMMRSSKLPLEIFGLTLKNWKRSLLEGVLFSIPFLLFITGLKYLLINVLPFYQDHQLFEPFALIKDPDDQTLKFWIFINVLYWFFIPAQELMARGALQGLLERFLTGERKVLMSILVSNLIFSTAHVYMSEWIALIAFTGGLFLGWLYSRTHNLIGVIVSHGLIGTYTLGVVGP